MNEYFIRREQRRIFDTSEVISSQKVGEMMQGFSYAKIFKPQIGKLYVMSPFVAEAKAKGLFSDEGEIVFYAKEMRENGFFSKLIIRYFIWKPLSNTLFAVSPEAVRFENLPENTEIIFGHISSSKMNIEIKQVLVGEEKIFCFQDGWRIFRKFKISKDKLVAQGDILRHFLHWENSDGKVQERFKIDDVQEAMYCYGHYPEVVKEDDPRLIYPKS